MVRYPTSKTSEYQKRLDHFVIFKVEGKILPKLYAKEDGEAYPSTLKATMDK